MITFSISKIEIRPNYKPFVNFLLFYAAILTASPTSPSIQDVANSTLPLAAYDFPATIETHIPFTVICSKPSFSTLLLVVPDQNGSPINAAQLQLIPTLADKITMIPGDFTQLASVVDDGAFASVKPLKARVREMTEGMVAAGGSPVSNLVVSRCLDELYRAVKQKKGVLEMKWYVQRDNEAVVEGGITLLGRAV